MLTTEGRVQSRNGTNNFLTQFMNADQRTGMTTAKLISTNGTVSSRSFFSLVKWALGHGDIHMPVTFINCGPELSMGLFFLTRSDPPVS